ncbi:unnamed protein product [Arctia plantaginis]|uniref:Uncharacterized protein n=1 Tax=Arctia plantaginis TaxID=874455 RepID=A0A8S0YW09_ARCPL|nr:unnamed protein product [Arctia plantaginis]
MTADELALSGNALPYGAGFGAFGAGPVGYGAAPFGAAPGYGFNSAATSGGGFAVTSMSPISPTGISVVSENAIEGPLSITGQLPFLGAIALEGALPTAGAGAINYGCGNGAVGIVSEGLAPTAAPAAYPAGHNYGAAGFGPGMGYPGMAGRSFNGLGGLGAVY